MDWQSCNIYVYVCVCVVFNFDQKKHAPSATKEIPILLQK